MNENNVKLDALSCKKGSNAMQTLTTTFYTIFYMDHSFILT